MEEEKAAAPVTMFLQRKETIKNAKILHWRGQSIIRRFLLLAGGRF
jgi:hypothetical protein